MRWGRAPVANLWLMPGPLMWNAAKNQKLCGIDGNEYVTGIHSFDQTLLFGYLAYGVKVDSDTGPIGPELPPEKMAEIGSGKMKRLVRQTSKDKGMFIPE